MLSDDQLLRFSRQIMLPQFDVAGQQRLLDARVLVVGLGGLGCPVALYLAAAGVGQLVLADPDRVELSNLQRQIAHGEEDIGAAKTASAAAAVARINRAVRVVSLAVWLTGGALQTQVEQATLVVDASDSLRTRLAINAACLRAGTPWVCAAAVRSEGQITVFEPDRGGPCYRCVYPSDRAGESLSCCENGVLAPVVGVLGSLQALEAVKLIAGYGEPLRGVMLLIDGWSLQVQRITLRKDPDCPHCGPNPHCGLQGEGQRAGQ